MLVYIASQESQNCFDFLFLSIYFFKKTMAHCLHGKQYRKANFNLGIIQLNISCIKECYNDNNIALHSSFRNEINILTTP